MSDSPLPTPNTTPGNQAPETNPTATPSEPISALGGTLTGAEPAPAPVEPPAAVEPAPVSVADFTLPEGITADDPAMATFLEQMNASKVSKESAQKLLDQHSAALKQAAEAPLKAFMDMNRQWVDQVKADPEIGDLQNGVKPEVSRAIATAIDQLGGKALRDALDLTGAGNNPAVVKAFYQMGKLISESSAHVSGNPAPSVRQVPSAAQAMYPHLAQKEG